MRRKDEKPERPVQVGGKGVYRPATDDFKQAPWGGNAERTERPISVGGRGVYLPGTGGFQKAPWGSDSAKPGIPSGVITRGIDAGVNPYEVTDPATLAGKIISNAGPKSRGILEREARITARNAMQSALDYGKTPEEADAAGQTAYAAYMRQFGGPPAPAISGAQQTKKSPEQRYAEKRAANMTHEEAINALAEEDLDAE